MLKLFPPREFKSPSLIWCLGTLLLLSLKVEGSTQFRSTSNQSGFYYDINQFKASLDLPIRSRKDTLVIPERIIQRRLEDSKKDPTIEPISLVIPPTSQGIVTFSERLALPGNEDQLERILLAKVKNLSKEKNKSDPNKSNQIPVQITKDIYRLLDTNQLRDLLRKPHVELFIEGKKLRSDLNLRKELFSQLQPFIEHNEILKIKDLIKNSSDIAVDRWLLPSFARKMVRNFISYRGPNCFHAALSFQNIALPRSFEVNVKEEKGYHKTMINYDELWAILNRSFYEVDIEKEKLQYGDMIVMFDVPSHYRPNSIHSWIDFRWIRHATTYLFNGFTFSKGSKSPNTPYAVRTLEEEWDTWSKSSNKLGVKVFRKIPLVDAKIVPFDLQDWLM